MKKSKSSVKLIEDWARNKAAECWMETTRRGASEKKSLGEIKSKDNANLFLRFQGHYPQTIRSAWPNDQWWVLSRNFEVIDGENSSRTTWISWCRQHDNAPSHRSVIVGEFLSKNQVCVLDHSPYSPDLAACDFFLLPPMKGKRYDTIENVQAAVTPRPTTQFQKPI